MNKSLRVWILAGGCVLWLGLGSGCGEKGEEGSTPVDCGAHGSEHDGDCHCDEGYLFNESTCVPFAEITELCAGEATHAAEEEHEHGACLCPAEGECFCDHGEVQVLGAASYCVPELHHE